MTNEPQPRVLIVDDDAEIRHILSVALAEKALQVDVATGGAEAIDLIRANRYDVVVIDLMMPHVSGFEVIDAIEPERRGTPIVLVVTGAPGQVLAPLDSRKIHGIVHKPFDPLEVAVIIAGCADLRQSSALGTMALAMLSSAPLLALLASRVG